MLSFEKIPLERLVNTHRFLNLYEPFKILEDNIRDKNIFFFDNV